MAVERLCESKLIQLNFDIYCRYFSVKKESKRLRGNVGAYSVSLLFPFPIQLYIQQFLVQELPTLSSDGHGLYASAHFSARQLLLDNATEIGDRLPYATTRYWRRF
ncbi:hypothetical protein QBC47DRAFT_362162 [Echria macrotheca]|uniref:Uncharacterized protein n=1 Tax=Echria macrotheca TaxID=438768 RepID=A0AAJ0B9J1_9PEZI|nr:hypothetical protein QBC47DRAFT_362162 [Echria macrotheca]